MAQSDIRQEVNWFRAMWQIIVVVLIVAVVAALVLPVMTGNNENMRRTMCLSSLKQISIANAMYMSDFDDYASPNYTFDGPEATKEFVNAIYPYTKNRDIFICGEFWKQSFRGVTNVESDDAIMSFVHCRSLQAIIPKFGEGHRELLTSAAGIDVATTPYLRDPMATKSKKEKVDAAIYSPHGSGFNTGFLDGHAKYIRTFDWTREL